MVLSGAPMERDTRLQSRLKYISPWVNRPPSRLPSRTPTERDATFLEPSLNYFSKLPVNGPPSPPGSPVGSLWRHLFPEPSATLTLITHLSLKVPSKRAPSMFPNRVPMERDAPSSEPVVNSFIYISQSSQWRSLPTKWGKTYGHSLWSPMRMEGLLTMGYGLVPQGDCLQHCYHYPSAMQPSARYLPPWLE